MDDSNIEDYIEIPDYIKDKRKRGIITLTHYSDIVRACLLCKYGGIWMDSVVLCTGSDLIHQIDKLPLFVFKQMDLIRRDESPVIASSWFISAQSNEKILLLTRDLLLEYWKKENSLVHYYLFHMFFSMAANYYHEEWESVPVFNNNSPHVLQFEFNHPFDEVRWNQIRSMSDIHKLNSKVDFSEWEDKTYGKYILREYLPKN